MTFGSPLATYPALGPAFIPAVLTAFMSAVWLMTTLWPITWAASLPVWVNSTVIFAHEAETVADFRSNCILSSPLSLSVQLGAASAREAAPMQARPRIRGRERFIRVTLSVGKGSGDSGMGCGSGARAIVPVYRDDGRQPVE